MSSLQTQLVKKTAIIESGDFNLSAARYLEKVEINSDYDNVKLVDLCDIYQPKTISQKDLNPNGKYDVYGANGIIGKYDQYNHENSEVMVTCRGATCGTVNKSKPFSWITGNAMVFKIDIEDKLLKSLLYYMLKNLNWSSVISGSAQPQITRNNLLNLSIPLPPLEIQEQIVKEIEGYQKIIDGCRQVVENYKPVIDIDPSWEVVELGKIGSVSMCKRIFKDQTSEKSGVPFYKIGTFGKKADSFIDENLFKKYQLKFSYPDQGDILISTSGTIGRVVEFDGKPAYFQDSNIVWLKHDKSKVLNSFLKFCYKNINWKVTEGVTIARLYNKNILESMIPLPKIETQKEIVEKLEKEREVIEGNKELIKIYEKKINDKIKELF